jgi:hypothetical protein
VLAAGFDELVRSHPRTSYCRPPHGPR